MVMKHSRSGLVGVVAAFVMLCANGGRSAFAQQDGAAKPALVRRIDLANAYRRLDAQFMKRLADREAEPPQEIDRFSPEWLVWTLVSERALAAINTAADRAAMEFFSGNIAGVARQMNALMLERPGSGRDANFAAMARSLHLEVGPARPTAAEMAPDGPTHGECMFSVSSIYPLPEGIEPPAELALVVSFSEPGSLHRSINQLKLHMDESRRLTGSVRVHLDGPIKAGTREILLRSGGMGLDLPDAPRRTFETIGRWTVLPEAIAAVRERLGRRLDAVAQRESGTQQQLAQDLFRHRLGLLDLADSPIETIALLTDYAQLMVDLEREGAEIEDGGNPYAGRAGDFWFGVKLVEDVHFPSRVYVPESALRKDAMPLIIALHGAGGDENLFVEGYGDGIIKRLADENGFAVVSPQASPLMDLGMAFDSIVSLMSSLYDIDENRIYVLGHSMGAMMTGGMTAARTDRIAAACWLAGASYGRAASIPPTLVIGGELDPIVPSRRVKAVFNVAREAGMDIEYREIKHCGHALMVGYVLPDVVDWLFEHTLDERSQP